MFCMVTHGFCRENETLTLHVMQVWLPAAQGSLSHLQAGCDPAVEGCSFACTSQQQLPGETVRRSLRIRHILLS